MICKPLFTLAELRNRAGLTLKQVADAVGVQPRTVKSWELYTTSPTIENARKICTVFGVDWSLVIWSACLDC